MRTSLVVTIVASIVVFSATTEAQASMRQPTAIPPQQLAGALQTLVKEREFQIIYSSDLLVDRRTRGATGELTMNEALAQLLSGTGLTYQYVDEKTVSIVPLATRPPTTEAAVSSAKPQASNQSTQTTEGVQKKSFWDRFRVAQVDQGRTASDGSVEKSEKTPENNEGVTLDEVVVTAQKRVERRQDVPVPVTVLNADQLLESNQLRIQDYYTRVPGLSVSNSIQSAQFLAIRGITTSGGSSGGNPTVSVMIDDVAYGSSTGLGGGQQVLDLDPSELSRIEVLRGPQGTLYGASSLGGLMKFVTRDPSLAHFSGRAQVGVNSVRHGNDPGYNVRGAVNVPVSSTWAMRASGFTRRDPGYIDNPILGRKDVNDIDVYGGRLAALWNARDNVTLKLNAVYQRTQADGSADEFPSTGELQQNFAFPGIGAADNRAQVYTATLIAKLGVSELTLLSGYGLNRNYDSTNYPFIAASRTSAQFGAGVTVTPFVETQSNHKFSQEARLTMPLGARVDWLLGGYYTDEGNSWEQIIQAANPTTAVVAGEWQHLRLATTYEEYAAFTDITFKFTDRFDVQVGGRQSEIRQSYTSFRFGPNVAGGQLSIPIRHSKANAFTYLVTPRLRLSPDMMAYARLASGYRPGGPNTTAALVAGLPAQYEPDKTQNYELGIKGSLLNHAVTFDASLFYIDWKDIQLGLVSSVGGYIANGSRAKSQGVELALESHPVRGLTAGAWVSWNDAQLTQALPPTSSVTGRSGDRLPLSARFSANLSLDQEFPLTTNISGFVGGSVSYVGNRLNPFTAGTTPRQVFPAYTRTDLRAGVRLETWSASMYVNNLTDRRDPLSGGVGAFLSDAFTYIQPRTVGLSLTKSY